MELGAELELVLVEEAPAVVGAQEGDLVAVGVEAGDAGLEGELQVGAPGDAVAVVAGVDGEVSLEGDVPAVLFAIHSVGVSPIGYSANANAVVSGEITLMAWIRPSSAAAARAVTRGGSSVQL